MSRKRSRACHPIIRQIIDRDCHVSLTNRDVVRHVISRLREGYSTFRAMSKTHRRCLIEDCIKHHRDNFELYRSVMSGSPMRRTRYREASMKSTNLSGQAICRLMRKHGVTIEALAFRMGITQKRIRQVRENGLSDKLAIRDWLQAITDIDFGPIPEKYHIRNPTEETACGFCGCPLFVGEDAFEYLNEVFCSHHCCRRSRGWP